MKNLRDLLLAAILLGAGGFGAYEIGSRVDHLSNQAASQDAELNSTTTRSTGTHHVHTIAGRHITPLLVGEAALVVLAAILAVALITSVVKAHKRQRWSVSN